MQNNGIIGNNLKIWEYLRLLKNKKLYVSDMYRRALQTQSSVVLFHDEHNVNKFGLIHSFLKILNCNCGQVRNCNCAVNHFAIVSEFQTRSTFVAEGDGVRYSSAKFMYKCDPRNILTAVPVQNIVQLCVYMNIDDQMYVAVPINDKELE